MGDPPLFDFIYIDGSHKACDVLSDSVLAWPLLRPEGVLIWDDYEWTPLMSKGPLHEPKLAIDAFLSCYADQYRVISKGYQVAIEKTTEGQAVL